MGAILVTGGLGFVGRHLVPRLARAGNQVVSYNRDFSETDERNVVCVQGELYDVPRLLRTLQEHGVDRVVHTAAMSHPELSVDLPITTFKANVDGTVHVFEAARLAGVERVVNFSSECAYGHHEGPITEEARLRPTTPYGVTKVTTELLGDVYRSLYGVDVLSLRITEVYGPGNRMPNALKDMLQAGLRGDRFQLEHGADHRFQFVWVEDVAAAAESAIGADGHRQGAYNVTGGRQVTLAEAAEVVRGVIPGAAIELGPGHIPTLDRQGPYDISAAERDLSWQPRMELEEGVRHYGEWLRAHPY